MYTGQVPSGQDAKEFMMLSKRTTSQTLLAASVLAFAGSTFAQTAPAADPKQDAKPEAKSSDAARGLNVTNLRAAPVHPGTQTLMKLMRTVTIEFKDNTLEDCLKFIHDVTGVEMEIFWVDDKNSTGLAKDTQINVTVKNLTALALLEKVLDKSTNELSGGGGATWQLADGGSLQIGTKDRLNKFRRLEIYDISDMLFQTTNKTNVPQFDLQQAFQGNSGGSGGGGGGGQSPFTGNQQQNVDNIPSREEQAKTIRTLITSLVETDQWSDNGGDGGSITYWQGTLMINAPDYMHRQVDGYKFWPNTAQSAGVRNGRRYVMLDSKVQNVSAPTFTTREIQAVTGGGR